MTDEKPAITATALADHIDAMITRHGDQPILQWDHDTWYPYPVQAGSITRQERPEEGVDGPVLVTAHVGYLMGDPDDGPPIAASAFAAELRAAAAEHGDLPIHQNDADTGLLHAFPAQEDEIRVNGIVITPVGY